MDDIKEAKIQLRVPVEIRNWFADYSKKNSRSMNGQVIEILKGIKNEEAKSAPH